ncbi:inorganic pyrophosphatase 2-like [Durio zibethinus]|uniref:Inorganic pyrophosphatase 2-like n=1 Tax=Durio zibethinus TaxID=66656 RepID=A0A6P5ZP29_DURZI|nr:inorganic pyrophosphatase 2-like [Durio zibethinus]
MAGSVLVFEFDTTIIECHSDYWVEEEFGVTDLFTQLRPNFPWNTHVFRDRMIVEAQSTELGDEEKLGEDDFLMPWKNFAVWELVCSNIKLIRANIHELNDGEELGTVLSNLINKLFSEENCAACGCYQIVPVDCKFHKSSVYPYQAF